MHFDYRVFGLNVRSDIPLPELFAGAGAGAVDVRIVEGAVAEAPPGLHADGDALVLTIEGVARYRIEAGSRIVVDAEPGVPARNVRLFLLGSAFGALLHQRRLLPLHANAVEIDGRAIAFMGESGAGKSTLATWFHDQGYRIIADDICVVRFDDDGNAFAQPGVPRLRLWHEALEASGRSAADYDRSYTDNEENKFDVPIDAHTRTERELPVGAIYLLERSERTKIVRMEGVGAVEAVFAHTYRGAFVAPADAAEAHWSAALALVKSAPVFRFARPWSLAKLDESCSQVLEHAAASIAKRRAAEVTRTE